MTASDPRGSYTELDQWLVRLRQAGPGWAARPPAERRELLLGTMESVAATADDWVTAACRIKGLDPSSPPAGEEWFTGPYAVLTALRDYADTFEALAHGRSPVAGHRLFAAPGGRRAVQVLPHRATDRFLLSGIRVRVWMRPGESDQQIVDRAGLAQRRPGTARGGVGVVLGAGNITAIPVLDVLYELLAHDRLSLLKLNPLTDPLLPVLRRALAPLIESGVLAVVTGGAAAGEHLVTSSGVDHVHLTGSAATYRAIVGSAGTPRVSAPVTAELGGVSPILVVPGRWSRRDLRFQAEHVATMRLHNNGYNCIAGQVLVVSADWPQVPEFLAEVRAALERVPRRSAYYPGSAERQAAAANAYPEAESLGGRLLVPDATTGPAATTEYFAPVLAVTRLPGRAAEFLARAIRWAESELIGNLGANVLIDPRTRRAAGPRFDELIAGLRYGTVAVNAWTGIGFATATAPWGAFPDFARDRDGAGPVPEDIGSGVGVVHNALLLDEPERTVVEGPFRPFPRSLAGGELSLLPRPPWFVTNRTARTTGTRMTRFAADGRLARLPAILWSALRG